MIGLLRIALNARRTIIALIIIRAFVHIYPQKKMILIILLIISQIFAVKNAIKNILIVINAMRLIVRNV
jgi:hypothetical protein